MTEKQKLFCSYYIQTLNATESYAKAYGTGLKTAGVNGCRLLEKASIKEFIENAMKNKNKSTIASEDEVLETITSILRDKKVKASDRLKASELLGKRYGSWIDKVQVDEGINIKIDFVGEDDAINED